MQFRKGSPYAVKVWCRYAAPVAKHIIYYETSCGLKLPGSHQGVKTQTLFMTSIHPLGAVNFMSVLPVLWVFYGENHEDTSTVNFGVP